ASSRPRAAPGVAWSGSGEAGAPPPALRSRMHRCRAPDRDHDDRGRPAWRSGRVSLAAGRYRYSTFSCPHDVGLAKTAMSSHEMSPALGSQVGASAWATGSTGVQL